MYSVSFYGNGETAGSVGERIQTSNSGETAGSVGNRTNTKNQETAGSIGKKYAVPDSIPEIEKNLKYDTLPFTSKSYNKSDTSNVTKVFGVATAAALAIAVGGYAHKVDAVSKLSNGKFKNILRKTDVITEPCHKLCSKIKQYAQKHDKMLDWLTWIV